MLRRLIGLLLITLPGSLAHAGPALLTVVDESGQPVAGASIMLGYEPGNPFPGNVFTTDAAGLAGVPDDWKAALPLTVQAPGFIANTIPVAQPGVQTLRLAHQEPQSNFEVKGGTNGYGRLITDGKVDFGLVIPALRRDQLLAFDISSIISPQTDTITIIGNDVKIPSNISLPQQQETYIFPITLNKPDYRMYVRTPGQYRLGITHGQFPLQRVVGDIRNGKSIFEVINYFDFKEGGSRVVDVNGNLAGQDMSVNQIAFNTTFNVKAPQFASGLTMMSLALLEQNGELLPTDLKRFTPGQSLNLKSAGTAGAPSVLSLLMENNSSAAVSPFQEIFQQWFQPLLMLAKTPLADVRPAAMPDFSKLSFAFLPAAGGAAPQFLPLIDKPVLNGQVMSFQVPALSAGLEPAAMYLTLSEIEVIDQGNVQIERRTRLWEVLSEAWLPQIELPKLTINRQAGRKYRWDVLFLAHPAHFHFVSPAQPRVDLQSITHATRNTVEI